MIRVIGINHKTAPVDIREKVAFTPEELTRTLKKIRNESEQPDSNEPNIERDAEQQQPDEVIILSTCNRTEIYTASQYTAEQITAWMPQKNGLNAADIKNHSYHYEGEAATRHIMRVASGLDSMVLGEPQIFGQLKSALKTATEHKTAGSTLKRLMQHAFLTAKKVRTQTGIGSNPVSVAFAAVNLAKQIFSQLERKTALLIGAGETIELVGKHLQNAQVGKVIIANRNVEKAQHLAEEFGGVGISLQDIGDYLADADIVISSTAAPMPIIGKGTVEAALKKRKHRPIFMVDIAVPRDIEAEVGQLDDIYLYTVDDLQSVIEDNLKSREKAATQGEVMINEEAQNFMNWLRAQDRIELVKSYREKIAAIQDDTLAKATRLLRNGSSPEAALLFLAHTLTNKLAHDATAAMNKAAHSGDQKLLEASNKLLNISQKHVILDSEHDDLDNAASAPQNTDVVEGNNKENKYP